MKRLVVSALVVLLLLTLLPQEAYSNVSQTKDENALNKGPMNSPWPMYRRDMRHTGRSPYGKMGCTGIPKWKIKIGGLINSSPVIDRDGIIYIGCGKLYALYPNGTIKWSVDLDYIYGAPALAEDGTIYACTQEHARLYAIDPDGNIKWNIRVGRGWIFGSPIIDENGIIYIGTDYTGHRGVFAAVYPDGTIKWRINVSTSGSAAKYNDTIYVASTDGYLYALYPDNGTTKWKSWVGCHDGSTCVSIGDDGTVYFSSFDSRYLYAFYPNGTLKWKYKIGPCYISPAIGKDGTLYVATASGGGDDFVYAFSPNGTLLWKLPMVPTGGGGLVIDKYGVIYGGGYYRAIYAVNPNGTLRWSYEINDIVIGSCPAIGEDGTIYIAAWDGYLYAIEPRDAGDLEITGIHLGFDVGGFRIKVKNVGCRPAHNVTCGVVMETYSYPWLEDELTRFEFTTTVPEIDVDEEVVVKIKGMFLNPLHYSPAFWDCSFELLYVEAEDANPDMLWEGGDFYPVTVFGPFVWVGGFILWLLGARGWIEV